MIQTIKSEPYIVCGGERQWAKARETKEKIGITSFDVQEILGKAQNYLYTEKAEKDLAEQLQERGQEKGYWTEEQIKALYQKGLDVENMDFSELKAYAGETATKPKKVEDEKLGDKLETIQKGSDQMYLYALSSPKVTIDSLYESNFKGGFKKSALNYSRQDISNVLKLNGVEENKNSIWAADLLMMYDMGVNAASINKLQNIQTAIASLDVKQSGLSGATTLMENQEVKYEPEYVDRITDELGMVTDEHIQKLIEEGQEVNIENLRESIHKNAHEILSDLKEDHLTDKEIAALEEETTAIKEQILTVAAKLTSEAAQKISGQMPLESTRLSKVAKALLEMEEEQMGQVLEEVELPVTKEHLDVLTQTMAAKTNIKEHFTETATLELTSQDEMTLREIQSALAHYMAHETPVEKRFGESLASVEGQIKTFLENNQLPSEEGQIEGAKALIAASMEVSEENLQAIETVVLKLNHFLEELTPVQAARMLKEGINPYHATIDEILDFTGKQHVEGLKGNVAEAIVALKQQGSLNDQQQEGMIGLYRILQAVTKDKEAVMGYLFKNQLPLTVENLQAAARYAGKTNIVDAKLDQHAGEKSKEQLQTAQNMLEKSEEAADEMAKAIKILEEMTLPVDAEHSGKMGRLSAILYPYIKEQFKKELGKFEGLKALPESFVEKLEVVQQAPASVLEEMREHHIPVTINNVYWMEQMSNQPELYEALLEANPDFQEKEPRNLEELEEALSKICQEAKEKKEEAVVKGNLSRYKNYKAVEEMTAFKQQRIEKEGFYQIPFIIEGERKLVSLYVYDQKGQEADLNENLKAVISYETKHLGTIKAYVKIEKDQLGFEIESKNESVKKLLNAHQDLLIQGLLDIGYHTQYTGYKESEVTQPQVISRDPLSRFEEII